MADVKPATHLTRPQWDCLLDASRNFTIATTNDTLQVLLKTADGGRMHHKRVITRLVELGWLRTIGPERFVITPEGRRAYESSFKSLPVRG